MMLLRAAKETDLMDIHTLALNSGIGLTTLPKDETELTKRLARAIRTFEPNAPMPDDAYYLFVLEDTNTHRIVGTSAIEGKSGGNLPFYTYKVTLNHKECKKLNIQQDYTLLTVSNETDGLSELCTLFLSPNYRKDSNGLLLSKARFLFIANEPSRFTSRIIAEIRGVSNEEGKAPFWDAVGYHFFKCSFAEAVALSTSNDKQHIANLMPEFPIYTELLPLSAQNVIGKPHSSSQAAMDILLHEGFKYNHFIDLFDAGPTVEVMRDKCRTLTSSQQATLVTTSNSLPATTDRLMVSNTRLIFRACLTQALVNQVDKTCLIHEDDARHLQLKQGDKVRVAPLN